MIIELKCFSTLSRFNPENAANYEIAEGTTTGEIIDTLGMDREEVKIIFINGRHVKPEAVVNAGDRVGFFPAVGGG